MSSYDRYPRTTVDYKGEAAYKGYEEIAEVLRERSRSLLETRERVVVAIDCYPGMIYEELEQELTKRLDPSLSIFSDEEIFQSEESITSRIVGRITDDRVFGQMCLETYEDLIDEEKLRSAAILADTTKGLVIVYGAAANILVKPDIYVYADLARWEIQGRLRRNEIGSWKSSIWFDDILQKYKWGYFFEWRVADRHKKRHFEDFDFVLDTNKKGSPVMITGDAFRYGLSKLASGPFRLVPFFDPGVWGGQWMKKVCGLDEGEINYAWCFDCVPEENSILLDFGGTTIELPAMDLVLYEPVRLLGERVVARFGAEFPIRFDFLDTMDGQNLSLQVHPTVEYIQEKFGMHYTQEESYYILDAYEDREPLVYLGLNTGTRKEEFFRELEKAQGEGANFLAERFANTIKVRKHDHLLIPPGTVHCSGRDTMVLEISSTPFIFTFKLWDWGRLGTDGKPRPINISHGKEVVKIERDTEWVEKNLINRVTVLCEEEGWRSERTGLHELQFIETVRDWFNRPVAHNTEGSVNVLNLVEGEEAIVESPDGSFEPLIVHYAETFVIPEAAGEYIIRPHGASEGKEITTIKARVRI
ncbi:class I mannose-6-phosphate isomerase [Youngiibacter multivorans]|uniref:Mannose-6-phosphate isomerase class I n=1 Tax=Youngiibacter multivorans TaxID=937251 RepID=A0ABS4G475_9CLOT|nr:class I mannose-6-phosphate isomerase [Youngiibacter multivorans]MBP1919348.1 mannose-6-phosphate isomerase class I [Youngiibacter multivorans]